MSLKNKVALVTGGSTGIGKAIATKLASMGADIVVNYFIGPEEAEKVAKELSETYQVRAKAIYADVSNFESASALIEETVKAFGTLNIVVNNAGITDDGLILRMSEHQFDRVIQTNLKGVFNVSKHAARVLLKSGYGRLINIASVIGEYGNVGQVNYAAAKAGVIGMTKTLAKEFASRGVTVNAIAPGFIETQMTRNLPPQVREEMLKHIALGTYGQPEDIANLVGFLSSPDAGYITGVVVDVDGGLTI
ncbi:3-oxoacyl-[acyl-carrier-protein] reductase FabG [Acholeplasma oculi]|uniref:3-oxoacyl-[acyl-carrier-protein] reductase n=1 Tax=Acholeplasma oculi TaxID=35623 RepID=A0A061A9X8_9MOLU|nr:3-oxoacyl-[acyl-carrier-protein] reductase [Acholeplasma oculi]CDR30678.1 3-oxoacyl-[acyl-carrier protein] reductase [Acholeplasma oculi]SKC34641.1 3-oxoacyl-[acyl-carrier-protein] reductase [Acholeplasma oculi]SUT89472.1 3-oxoacyl-[acyl-carrier-protein] reductase FabG [Acholeplasma oculi]